MRIRVGSGLFPISVPTVSVAELTFAGQVVIAQTFKVFEVWAIVGALYLVLILSILAAAKRLERGLGWPAHT